MKLKQVDNIYDRLFAVLPPFYSESEIMRDIYNAIAPEFESIANYLTTPDSNSDPEIIEENDNYRNNKIGWGHERLLNQFMILGVNHLLKRYAQLYDVSFETDYIQLRNKLLLVANLIENNNIFNITSDFNAIQDNVIIDMIVDYPNYEVEVQLGTVSAEVLAIVQRHLRRVIPAHMSIAYIQSQQLTTNIRPHGTTNTRPRYVLRGS